MAARGRNREEAERGGEQESAGQPRPIRQRRSGMRSPPSRDVADDLTNLT